MNEIELIRGQLAAERQRAFLVARACLAALEREPGADHASSEFRSACVAYLMRVLQAFEERDQRLAELLRLAAAPPDPTRAALGRALALHGHSREVLEKLEAACAELPGPAARDAWKALVAYFVSVWGARRDALDALLASHNRVTDWRAIGAIDADSVLEERRSYARLCALLPAGVILPPVTVTRE